MNKLRSLIAFYTTCADGWESPSIGQGTCSHHGGIADNPSDNTITIIIIVIMVIIAIIGGIIYFFNSKNSDNDYKNINEITSQNEKEKRAENEDKNNSNFNEDNEKLVDNKNEHKPKDNTQDKIFKNRKLYGNATERQLNFMAKHKIKFKANITKQEAHEKISKYIEDKKQKNKK